MQLYPPPVYAGFLMCLLRMRWRSPLLPLLVTIMAALLLGEYVGIHRWAAVILGLVALVLLDLVYNSHPAYFAANCRLLFAGRQVISRFYRIDKTETTVAYTAIASR